ncbi:MAG: MATE family efflux transporter [Actinomycetota bacterium]|nr:MATE family efflux transporter [Actinomycetota bacterium]
MGLVLRSPFDRDIARLAVPAVGALAAEPLYVLTDTAIVGRIGTPQLGGLAIAATILLTTYSLFVFLAYGTTGTVARLLGAGEIRAAAHQGVQALWLAAAIGVVVAAVGMALARPAVAIMGAGPQVAPFALTYLRISLVGVPSLMVVLAGTGYLRGLQDTRTPLVVAVGSAVANLVIEVVLVFGLDTGIAGSAWSTVVAQTGAALAYLAIVARHVRAAGAPVRPDRAVLRALATVSRHLFVRTAALRFSLTMATAVAARLGVVELGAHQVAFEIWSFLALVLDAIAIAGQAMVGRLLGAGDGSRARAASRRMVEWGVAVGLVFGALVAGASAVLPRLFTDDADVARLASFLLLLVAALQPLNAVVFVLDGVLIGAGDLRYLAWAMVGAAAAFVPAGLAVNLLGLGIGWLWAALVLLMAARLVALGARWHHGTWAVVGARPPSRP